MHWKSMYESKYLASWDLPEGRDAVATIDKCVQGEIVGQQGRSEKKPLLYLSGKDKPIILNKTNGRVICGMYGPDTRNWRGKRISLYIGETNSPSEGLVPCIRIRPTPPTGNAKALSKAEEQASEQPAEEDENAPI